MFQANTLKRKMICKKPIKDKEFVINHQTINKSN